MSDTPISQRQVILWARDFFPWMRPRYAILSVLAFLRASNVPVNIDPPTLCP